MTSKLFVSDHAILRYLERIAGLDIERIKNGIRRKVRHAANAGANSITVDGFEYRLDGNTVVTVIAADDSHEAAAAFGEMTSSKSKNSGS